MTAPTPQYHIHFAQNAADISAAQRLRYQVFVTELGGQGALTDHSTCCEADHFDAHADHLLLRDMTRPSDDQVIGVYRLMNQTQAEAAGGFSSAQEYDLTPLLSSGRPLLELGRSCLHPDYRGGEAMHHLWQALAKHVRATGTEIIFGVASFHGTNAAAIAGPLAHLHDQFLAPEHLRPQAVGPQSLSMAHHQTEPVDRKQVVAQIPALIKAYLRLGGGVGAGAFVDHSFNTIDVCMVVDVQTMPHRLRAIYAGDTT